VLTTTSWPRIEQAVERVAKAGDSATPSSYVEGPLP
jgi:hypothetical protein